MAAIVVCSFLTVPFVGPQCVIVTFPGHTPLLLDQKSGPTGFFCMESPKAVLCHGLAFLMIGISKYLLLTFHIFFTIL